MKHQASANEGMKAWLNKKLIYIINFTGDNTGQYYRETYSYFEK